MPHKLSRTQYFLESNEKLRFILATIQVWIETRDGLGQKLRVGSVTFWPVEGIIRVNSILKALDFNFRKVNKLIRFMQTKM